MNKPIVARGRQEIEAILAKEGGAHGHWTSRSDVRWGLALFAVLVLAVVWASGGRKASIKYTTEPAVRGSLVVLVTATGSVQPTNKVDVSSELSGTIRKVLVDYNSSVTAGQTLAVLDTDKLQATVDSSKARVAAAEAKVVDAEATMIEKQRDLVRKKLLAEKTMPLCTILNCRRHLTTVRLPLWQALAPMSKPPKRICD